MDNHDQLEKVFPLAEAGEMQHWMDNHEKFEEVDPLAKAEEMQHWMDNHNQLEKVLSNLSQSNWCDNYANWFF